MSDLDRLMAFMERKTIRGRYEAAKLGVSEWWLRAVLRRPPALEHGQGGQR